MRMDRLTATLATLAAERARRRRIRAAALLREELPHGVSVSEEADAIVVTGRRLGFRRLTDPALAVLRDLAGWLR